MQVRTENITFIETVRSNDCVSVLDLSLTVLIEAFKGILVTLRFGFEGTSMAAERTPLARKRADGRDKIQQDCPGIGKAVQHAVCSCHKAGYGALWGGGCARQDGG